MKNKLPVRRAVYIRYGLLCLPEIVVIGLVLIIVGQWMALPQWLVWGIVSLWIVKDVVLFPFVWRAYDPDRPSAMTSGDMVGQVGLARERLDPSGYVQMRGELWKAERDGAGAPIEAGCRVRVRRREGLTLFVTSDDAD